MWDLKKEECAWRTFQKHLGWEAFGGPCSKATSTTGFQKYDIYKFISRCLMLQIPGNLSFESSLNQNSQVFLAMLYEIEPYRCEFNFHCIGK